MHTNMQWRKTAWGKGAGGTGGRNDKEDTPLGEKDMCIILIVVYICLTGVLCVYMSNFQIVHFQYV